MDPEQLKTVLAAHKKWRQGSRDHTPADLSGVNLREADLRGEDLSGVNLREADLRGADLSGADFSGANLSKANLRAAGLCGANLRGAALIWADLIWADLSGANLSKANLRGAELRGADLSGTGVARLHTTHEVTIYPDRVVYGCESRTVAKWRAALKSLCEEYEPERAEVFEKEIEAILALAEVLSTAKDPTS